MSDADRRRRFIAFFNGPPFNGDRQRLINLTGISEGRVSQYFDPKQAFGERAARSLAERMGVDESILLRDPIGSETQRAEVPKGLAHQLSRLPAIVFPITMDWGDLMGDEIPEAFSLVVKDDSMSDDYEVGDLVFFKKKTLPTPGKKVLVLDRHGDAYIRKYRMRGGKHWEAVASNSNYATLDSVADGLTVVAVAHGSYRE